MIVMQDVDGVLNSNRWRRANPNSGLLMIDPASVAMLNPLVEAGAKFVLSSTWRERYDARQMTAKLRLLGFTGEFIDCTALDSEHRRASGLWTECKTRGVQVSEWINSHPGCGPFVIFDDDDGPDYWAPVYDRLVRIDSSVGLQPKDVEIALKMLAT